MTEGFARFRSGAGLGGIQYGEASDYAEQQGRHLRDDTVIGNKPLYSSRQIF